MNNTTLETTKLDHDTIAFCAYMLWDNEGRPVGREQEHWLKAEAHLRDAMRQNGKNHHAAATREIPAPVAAKPVNRVLTPAAPEKSPGPSAPKARRKTARSR